MNTLFDRIWDQHLVADLGGGIGLILIDRVLLHERTGSVALESLAAANRAVAAPKRAFVTMDHVVDTLPGRTDRTIMPTGTDFIRATRKAALAAGLTLFDLGNPRQGIVHVISPENAIVLPGLTLVCPDSHTCTQGAIGAMAWGIGSTEAEHALATGTLRVKRPPTMRVTVNGTLRPGVTPKDLALHLLQRFGSSGGSGHAVEYAGDVAKHVGADAQTVHGGLQLLVDGFGSQGMRRIDMRQSRDGDVLEEHLGRRRGWPKGRQGYRLPCFLAPLGQARSPCTRHFRRNFSSSGALLADHAGL